MIEIEEKNFDVHSLTKKELAYWSLSTRMPIDEIKSFIDLYDKNSLKLDELKFISDLQLKYNVSIEDVFKRIRQVREIMKYNKQYEKYNLYKK